MVSNQQCRPYFFTFQVLGYIAIFTPSQKRIWVTSFSLYFFLLRETQCFNYQAFKNKYYMEKYVMFSCLSRVIVWTASVSQQKHRGGLHFIWRCRGRSHAEGCFGMWHFCLLIWKICLTSYSCKWQSYKTKWNSRNSRQGLWEKYARPSERDWSDDERIEEEKSRYTERSCWRWVGVSRCSITFSFDNLSFPNCCL